MSNNFIPYWLKDKLDYKINNKIKKFPKKHITKKIISNNYDNTCLNSYEYELNLKNYIFKFVNTNYIYRKDIIEEYESSDSEDESDEYMDDFTE